MLPYALTIFLGAFLLFQIQPLIAKYILPWFGGGPAVWTTCMLFFQVLLLAGYAYAHLSIRTLRPRAQVGIHLALLAAALTQLPVTPAEAWKPIAVELPTWQILLLLTASLALPYLVLSSTTPLLQAWFSRARPGRSPYRLYALSNLGSLLALVSYPFVVEPVLSRSTQTTIWSLAFVVYGVICAACAVSTLRARKEEDGAVEEAQVGGAVEQSRSFYGVLSVDRRLPNTPEERLSLWHGRAGHGAQFAALDRRRLPTAYYAPTSGDAIPLHLLTKEAFEIYLSHLQPDGVIALLISTDHIHFAPLVRRLADHFGLFAVRIDTPGRALNEDWGSNWMLMTRNRAFLRNLAGRIPIDADSFAVDPDQRDADPAAAPPDDGRLWTDDYASLFPLLWR